MKSKMNLKSILIMAILGIVSLFFINMSLAANTAKINVETANLRETPNGDSKILELLSLDEEVEIIEKEGEWYKVKARGMVGYLREDLIAVNGEATQNSEEQPEASAEQKQENETNPEEQNGESQQESKEENPEEKVEEQQENQEQVVEENKLGKQQIKEDTNLKILPVINATNTIQVKKDEEVNAIELVNGWACVETSTTKGWIREEKLQKLEQTEQEEQNQEQPEEQNTEEQEQPEQEVAKTLYVNTTTANVRKEANTSSEIVTSLPLNTAVEVFSEVDGWSKVTVNGKEGYISSALLSENKQETSRSSAPRQVTTDTQNQGANNQEAQTASVPASGVGSNVIETAKQYLGCKYVYGGTTPSGFDCSGFTSYIYRLHGVSLNRTAAAQYSNGVAVSRGDLQPGDLVMFGKSGINHVGIYMGGGQIIHAANPSRGVTTDTINSGYYNNNYVGARRIM